MLFLLQASRMVEHSDAVLAKARTVEKQLLAMQTRFRGFRLSGDAAYLEGYRQGIAPGGIPAQLAGLEEFVRDRPGQTAVIAELRDRVQRWFDFTAQELEAVRGNAELMQCPAFLNELGDAIRPLPDPDTIIAHSVDLLGRFLKVSRCAYASVDPDSGHFSIVRDFTDGCASTVGEYDLDAFGERTGNKMRTGRTLVIRDLERELSGPGDGDAFRAIGISAIICCPLHKNGRLKAMMAVHQTTPRDWTESEVMLVESVVERCWSSAERKRAETELVLATAHAESAALAAADAAHRFQLLGDVISLQVWTATPDGQLDYVNGQCLKYFGTEDDSMVLGNAWNQFVHPEDLETAASRWQRSLTTGERYSVEFRLRGAEHGDYRWFLVRAEPMRNREGAIVKWFGTNTAIHKLKLPQSEAERASRAKDDFIAALSHELRTPLTPVLMTAAALRDDVRLPADVREQMAMMERNIALEARLIDDLLDLTAISRGKLQLRPEPCDAHSLISLAVEIVRNDAQTRGLILDQEFSAPFSGLIADPARFQQVIWNLLSNAVKFTPAGGRISIRTSDRTDPDGRRWFSVAITDTGIGILRPPPSLPVPMKVTSVLTLGPAADFPALLSEAVSTAFPGAVTTAVPDLTAATQVQPPHRGLELLLLTPNGDSPSGASEALSVLDADHLPRWAVLRFGQESGAIPPDNWMAPTLAALLTETAVRHALHRDNARLRGDLLTMARRVSHDLRTPLGGIIATVDMLAETIPAAQASTGPVFSSIDEITKILNRTSFLLKAIAQPQPPKILSMGTAVKEALTRLERAIYEKQAVIHQPETWPEVAGVPSWLELIWWNLLHNSLQHTGPSPVITLGWKKTADGHRFLIRDSGPGAMAKSPGGAFSPFHRLHDPNAPRGLGLPIVRRLTELEGGTCGHDAAAGEGSVFFFTLPE